MHEHSLEDQMRLTQPLILLGMHRSGTTLVTRLLSDLGVQMGAWLSRDAEAVFFQRLNRRIFGAAGADWANPGPLLEKVERTDFVDEQAQKLLHALFTRQILLGGQPGIRTFFGGPGWKAWRAHPDLPWGWKDPRTTLLFPIWLQVFSHARVVHLVRNGIDVAISTHRRSLKQQRKLRNRIFPIDYKPVTLDFRYCFHLWETYVHFVIEHRHLIPAGQYLEIRYEDLLRDPMPHLHHLLAFIDHPVSDAELARACQQINTGRLDNAAFARPYAAEIAELTQRPLMQALGYA